MKEKFHVIIPARYGSTRLKAKILIDIAGKPMIQRVYEQVLQSKASSIVIATDDERIKKCAEGFGANVCMTRGDHPSGTSRLAEAAKKMGLKKDAIVVGVQGDEPLIPPTIIDQVAANLVKNKEAAMATLCDKITNVTDLFNPNIVKVLTDKNGYALYFSRAPIPWERDNFCAKKITSLKAEHFRHIGIYAYRVELLQKYVRWQPTDLEKTEMLEQLRIMYYGGKIHVGLAKANVPLCVDTPEDLEKMRKLIAKL